MYVIHHHNWHLWYYNRFLLINWYIDIYEASEAEICQPVQVTQIMKIDLVGAAQQRRRRRRRHRPKMKNHTVIFFMATYTRVFHTIFSYIILNKKE